MKGSTVAMMGAVTLGTLFLLPKDGNGGSSLGTPQERFDENKKIIDSGAIKPNEPVNVVITDPNTGEATGSGVFTPDSPTQVANNILPGLGSAISGLVSTAGIVTSLAQQFPMSEVLGFFGVNNENDLPAYITAENALQAGWINADQYQDVVGGNAFDANYTEQDYLDYFGIETEEYTLEDALEDGYIYDDEYWVAIGNDWNLEQLEDFIWSDEGADSFNNGWTVEGLEDEVPSSQWEEWELEFQEWENQEEDDFWEDAYYDLSEYEEQNLDFVQEDFDFF